MSMLTCDLVSYSYFLLKCVWTSFAVNVCDCCVNHLIKDKFVIVFEVIVLTILFLFIVFSEVNA